ncbi:DUF4397 domain-containing protein [Motilimonas eburnea]|uniref:DUF4397 domain-containing protein n=1 Tax=Motilimonas eburnea TaxID=1737488 RepID=UPI001E5F45F5|nr:DUF4397 domain-containing protein [Motilimonas eburnea]MCE2572032.1 DUF4397 domain-containing protein [Motilimonas eburnea]
MNHITKLLVVSMTALTLSACEFIIGDSDDWKNLSYIRAVNLVAPQIDVQNTDSKGVWTEDLATNLNYGDYSARVKFDLGSDERRTYLIKAIDSNSREDIVETHQVPLERGMEYLLYQFGDVEQIGLTRPSMRTSQIFTSKVNTDQIRLRFIHAYPQYWQDVDVYVDNYKRASNLQYGKVSVTSHINVSTSGGYRLRVVKANLNPDVPENQLLDTNIYLDNESSYQVFVTPKSPSSNQVSLLRYKEPTE